MLYLAFNILMEYEVRASVCFAAHVLSLLLLEQLSQTLIVLYFQIIVFIG